MFKNTAFHAETNVQYFQLRNAATRNPHLKKPTTPPRKALPLHLFPAITHERRTALKNTKVMSENQTKTM